MSADLGGEAPCLLDVVDDQRNRPDHSPARPDLATPAAIHDLVTRFYREIVFDDLLAPVFEEVAEVDWTTHIPNLIDYWCWIVLGTDRYAGAVTATHRQLHERQPLTAAHCDRWYELWCSTIDETWAGPRAEKARSHAAVLMSGMAKHVFGFTWVPPSAALAAPLAPAATTR